MPSKNRAKCQRKKQEYAINCAERRQQSRLAYAANSDVIKQNSKHARLCVAYKIRERTRKRRSMTDEKKRAQHRAVDRESRKRSMRDDERRAQHRAVDRESKKKLMRDDEKRVQHREIDRESRKKSLRDDEKRAQHRAIDRKSEAHRLKDESYRKKRIKVALNSRTCRLQNDAEFQKHYRQVCYRNQVQRLQRDAEFKERNRQIAYNNQVRRLQCDLDFCNRNREKAKERKKHLRGDERNRRYNTQWMRSKRQLTANLARKTGRALTRQQVYWIKRCQRISAARQMSTNWLMKRRMCLQSNVSEVDVALLFNKAQKLIKKAELKATLQHQKLVISAEKCLEHFVNNIVSEEAVDAAYSGLRYHNYSTEPYYWEQAYHELSNINLAALPVDDTGSVHVFLPTVSRKTGEENESTAENRCDEEDRHQSTKTLKHWQCNTAICRVTHDLTEGLVALLRHLVAIRRADVCVAYLALDRCAFSSNTGKSGHLVNCSPDCGCKNSRLNAARALSCHYPQLRSQIRRLYEVRSIAMHVKAVKEALAGADFKALTNKTAALKTLLETLFLSACKDKHTPEPATSNAVCEDDVMSKHGTAMRAVCRLRDSYVTACCDLCEQLRKDILPLASYEGRKGFSSEKLQTAIDRLYQCKTQCEDVDKFMQTTYICSYCADKLRGNKDVARSAFNCLTVDATPDCIKQLNMFEKVLIKFTMTCQVIVRLGQVSNKKRP